MSLAGRLRAALDQVLRGLTTPRAGAPGGPVGTRRALPDFTGVPTMSYAADLDGVPDTGEIVWTWVAFEEDATRGKDRPVLLVGRDGPWLLGLPLTSKDHDRDAAQEARAGRHWVDIGSGGWDARGRPSEVRGDRVVRVDPAAVRRPGAILPRSAFDVVVAEVLRHRD